ncbi:MAG: GNAT family N-acetyltransferase [Mogibacterium sp.]|nr:GNAT family N-acetyltransferase [Mogibacterium sp.]
MKFRKATAADMEGIMQLVCDIFDFEQGIPREMNAIGPERAPQWWCATDEETGEVIGAVASYEAEGKTHLGRFVIRPDHRGAHLGTKLMRFAIEDLFAQGREILYTESRPQTVRILQRLGGKITGEPFEFFEGTCTPIDIRREDYIPEA